MDDGSEAGFVRFTYSCSLPPAQYEVIVPGGVAVLEPRPGEQGRLWGHTWPRPERVYPPLVVIDGYGRPDLRVIEGGKA